MKKSFLAIALMLIFAAGISAQEYTHSVGGTIGTLYGFSYKGLFGNLAVEADLGVNLLGNIPFTSVTKYDNGEKVKTKSSDIPSGFRNWFYFTFEANPNVMYQGMIKSWGWGSISWFAGGGVSFGFITTTDRVGKKIANDILDDYSKSLAPRARVSASEISDYAGDFWTDEDWAYYYGENGGAAGNDSKVDFKWGLNAIGGAEIHFHKFPMAVSIDFRPGYGMAVPKQLEGAKTLTHFFDYKVVTGVRYTF
ncbi:MAG TPA: hypothetical protein DEO38_01430 [Bacteroidales bacterium]|jgi:hypothetical protein|nr:hypothetical protein [Bacteroidales bacterium]